MKARSHPVFMNNSCFLTENRRFGSFRPPFASIRVHLRSKSAFAGPPKPPPTSTFDIQHSTFKIGFPLSHR